MIDQLHRSQAREIVENQVSWFNGWKASDERQRESCAKAVRLVFDMLAEHYTIKPKKLPAGEMPLEFLHKDGTLKQPPSIDGASYNPAVDGSRLSKQFLDVWNCLKIGGWWSLADIESYTGHPQSSISARIRDFRKAKFGSHNTERKRAEKRKGTFVYRLVVNETGGANG